MSSILVGIRPEQLPARTPVTPGYVARVYRWPLPLCERIVAHAGRPMSAGEFKQWLYDGGAATLPTAAAFQRAHRAAGGWRAKKVGLVYFIEAIGCDRIKVGFTSKRSVEERAKNIQTSCPFQISVLASHPGSMLDEWNLHQRFAAARVASNIEWFHATEELRSHIAGLVST